MEQTYFVTGTYHGSHISSTSEGEARKLFRNFYKGESITHLSTIINNRRKILQGEKMTIN